jgi:hypothetical protein
MIGLYENFPENIHRVENFTSVLPIRKLQQKLVHVLCEINRKTFSFEEIGHPALRGCTIIFEAGIAESKSFSFIDEEEAEKMVNALKKGPIQVIDLFLAVRYYKTEKENRIPLKFDYYMMRNVFDTDSVEMRVFHERGPRYISPEEVVTFLVNMINEAGAGKILKKIEPVQNSRDLG